MALDNGFLNNNICIGKYILIEQIGDGGYSVVMKAKLHNNSSNEPNSSSACKYSDINHTKRKNSEEDATYALKIVKIDTSAREDVFDNEYHYASLFRNCNFSVQLYDHYKFLFRGEVFGALCMEMMDIDVMDYILRVGHLNEYEAKFIFKEMCKIVSHLHINHIAHLDIKPENFLLSFNSKSQSIKSVKICDYGFTRRYPAKGKLEISHSHVIGTKEYRPPELRQTKQTKKILGFLPRHNNRFSFYADKADIWSLGISLFVILTGYFPFVFVKNGDDINNDDVSIHNSDISYFTLDVSKVNEYCADDKCYQLLSRMLNDNPKKRPTIQEILNDPWFDKMVSDAMDLSTDRDYNCDNIDSISCDLSDF